MSGKGYIAKNKHKAEDKHPDLRGKGSFNGVEFEVAGWLRKNNEGDSFYSLSFSEPRAKTDAAAPKSTGRMGEVIEIPF